MQNKEHIARQGGRNDSHDHRCRCQRSSSKIAVETSGSLEVPERHGAPTQWMSGWMDTVQGWLRWLREGGGHIEVETVGFWGEQRHLKWWGLEAQSTAGASPSDKLPLGCLPAARVCLPRYCGSPSSFPPGSDCALAGWLAGGARLAPKGKSRGGFPAAKGAAQVLCQVVLFLFWMARHQGDWNRRKGGTAGR